MLLVRILSSWIPQLHQYRFMHFIFFYTDPYLNFFRRWIPPFGMLDFSPIVAFMCLGFLQNTFLHILMGFL
jgi:YggT family protein